MARSEKRTLEIRATLKDLITAPLGGMQGSFVAWSRRVTGSVKNVLGSVFNLKTAIVGLGASVLSLSTVRAFGDQADALLKLSRATGDTIENLSDLQAVFKLSNVEAEAFEATLKALLVKAGQANLDKRLADSFAALGITLRDLRSLSPSQLFESMAIGLERYGTEQEKIAALSRILPDQYLKVLDVAGRGLRAFQDTVRSVRESGATVTGQQAKVAERLNDSLSKIQFSIGGVSRALLEQFGPDAIALFEKMAKGITDNRDGVVAFAGAIGSGLVRAFGLATDAAIGLVGIIEMLSPVSLVDQKQVAELRTQLQLIDDFRRAGSPTTGNLTSTVLTPNRDLPGIPDIGFVTKSAEEMQALVGREGEIRRRLAELEETMQLGVAGAMRRARDRLSDELAAVAADVRGQGAASAPAPEARIGRWFGSGPDGSYQAGIGDSIKRAFGDGAAKDVAIVTNALEEFADEADKAGEKVGELGKFMGTLGSLATAANGDWGKFWGGFKEGAKSASAEIMDFKAAGENASRTLLLNGFNGLSDAFADVLLRTKSLKESFRDLARSMLSDIARITTRMLIMNAIQGATSSGIGGLLGLEKGGVVQGTMGTPVRAFANGGVTNGPTLALFGEGKKREAFVPLPDNRTIPVTLNGGAGGDVVEVHFHINAVDAKSVQQLLLEQGKTIAAVVADQASGRNVRFRQDMARAAR